MYKRQNQSCNIFVKNKDTKRLYEENIKENCQISFSLEGNNFQLSAVLGEEARLKWSVRKQVKVFSLTLKFLDNIKKKCNKRLKVKQLVPNHYSTSGLLDPVKTMLFTSVSPYSQFKGVILNRNNCWRTYEYAKVSQVEGRARTLHYMRGFLNALAHNLQSQDMYEKFEAFLNLILVKVNTCQLNHQH